MQRETLTLWDPVVRLFHWSLVICFVADYWFTEEGDDWHNWLGYYAVGWLVVRLLWGFIGPTSARWSDFWPTPASLRAHASTLVQRKPYHRLGHSPIGALVMILMMLLMLGLGVTGFLMEEVDYFWGEDLPRDIHEFFANALLALACVHVLAALVESLRLKENLPLSMITGRRRRL